MIEIFLKGLREQGWKLKDIAEKIDVAPGYVSRLKDGANCSLETVIKLADTFNVTADEVLGRAPAKPRTPTEELLLQVTEGNDEITRAALRSAQGEKLMKQAGGEGVEKKRGKAA